MLALVGLPMLMACAGPYDRLHEQFSSNHDANGRKLSVDWVAIAERNRKAIASIGDSTSVYLADESLYLVDKFFYFPGDARIPASAVDACSMVCFGSNDRNVALVLGGAGIQVEVTDSGELRRWCWSNRIPVISSEERKSWLYEGRALPAPTLEKSYQTFDQKMRSSCSGY